MEGIRQAVELAKVRGPEAQSDLRNGVSADVGEQRASGPWSEVVALKAAHLQSRRIVAFDGRDDRTRAFDILRTEILRLMDLNGWKTLAVTSPTPGCGKTLTAVNLALSIGRQPERRVSLIDLDLRKPQVAACLGLKCRDGALGVVQGHVKAANAMIEACVGTSRLSVMPTAPSPYSSDLAASSAMKTFLRDIAQQSGIAVLDLPPLLTGHDVIAILPQVDCVLLVTAVGISKVSEIKDCIKYLETTNLARVVLNMVPESMTGYTYY